MAAGLVTGHTQAVEAAFVKVNASLESLCEKQAAEAAALTLDVANEPVPDVPGPPPSALLSSPVHQLQRLASTHARYLCNTLGAQPSAGPPTEQQDALEQISWQCTRFYCINGYASIVTGFT